jgi:hypothetical protein
MIICSEDDTQLIPLPGGRAEHSGAKPTSLTEGRKPRPKIRYYERHEALQKARSLF